MARRDLVDGSAQEVRLIAQRWGFTVPAYFARAFGQAHRQPPTAAHTARADQDP